MAQSHAAAGKRLPRLGTNRCQAVVANAFENQSDRAFMEVFRRQFLKTLKKQNITELPDDAAEQDRLILQVRRACASFRLRIASVVLSCFVLRLTVAVVVAVVVVEC